MAHVRTYMLQCEWGLRQRGKHEEKNTPKLWFDRIKEPLTLETDPGAPHLGDPPSLARLVAPGLQGQDPDGNLPPRKGAAGQVSLRAPRAPVQPEGGGCRMYQQCDDAMVLVGKW